MQKTKQPKPAHTRWSRAIPGGCCQGHTPLRTSHPPVFWAPQREGCSPARVSWLHEGVLGSCPHPSLPPEFHLYIAGQTPGYLCLASKTPAHGQGSPGPSFPLSFLWRAQGCRWRLGRGLGWAPGLVRCGVDPKTVTIINALVPLPGTFFPALLCWLLLLIAQHSFTQVASSLGSSPRAGLVTLEVGGWAATPGLQAVCPASCFRNM